MDVDQLRAFIEVVETGRFSAAAQRLGLTQPTVTRRVQQLERELGFSLMDRDQRPVRLTQAGREFLGWAKQVIAGLEGTLQRLRGKGDEISGAIRIAASTIPGEFLVPALLARFTARYSRVRPELVVTDSARVMEEVLAGGAEVGFLGAPLAQRRVSLTPFAQDEIVLAVPVSHPFYARETVALSELSGQSLVEREGGSGTLGSLRRLLAEHGMKLPDHRVAMLVGTSQAQLAAIEAGVGPGFVSSLAVEQRSSEKVSAVRIEGIPLRRTLYLAHRHAPLSPVARALVQFTLG